MKNSSLELDDYKNHVGSLIRKRMLSQNPQELLSKIQGQSKQIKTPTQSETQFKSVQL
jgi:hypothetical protein